uniref:Large ribosomal subunit protein mL49 n=1 Tax=Salarias fasciatus TaxID=181472 RepID=A0A672HBU6_SALFA
RRSASAEEYRFVERLIPPSRIPVPPKHAGPAPSGWIPPADNPPPLPYMVRRSRMHNIPMTLIRKVEGDIWSVCVCVLSLSGLQQRDVVRDLCLQFLQQFRCKKKHTF